MPLRCAVLCRKTDSGRSQAFFLSTFRKTAFPTARRKFHSQISVPIFLSHVVSCSHGGFPLTLTDPLCVMDPKAEILCSGCQTLCSHKNMTACCNFVQISVETVGFLLWVSIDQHLKHQAEASHVLACSARQYSVL